MARKDKKAAYVFEIDEVFNSKSIRSIAKSEINSFMAYLEHASVGKWSGYLDQATRSLRNVLKYPHRSTKSKIQAMWRSRRNR